MWHERQLFQHYGQSPAPPPTVTAVRTSNQAIKEDARRFNHRKEADANISERYQNTARAQTVSRAWVMENSVTPNRTMRSVQLQSRTLCLECRTYRRLFARTLHVTMTERDSAVSVPRLRVYLS